MSIPASVAKVLYAKSGNRCAFPNCNCQLTGDKNQSEMAHIISEKINGPRHIPNYNNGDYDTVDNIILLCPNHHVEIDSYPEKYPVYTLIEMKKAHESKVANALEPITHTQMFLNQFIEICQRNHIEQLLELNIGCSFNDVLFEYIDCCYNELNQLLNKPSTVYVDKKIFTELYDFNSKLNYLYQNITCCTNPLSDYSDIAVFRTNIDIDIINELENTKQYLINIYCKYRFDNQ